MKSDVHRVPSEEGLEIPLSGRVREVSYVKATSFSRSSDDRFIFCSVDGISTRDIICPLRCDGGDGGIGQVFGNSVDGRHCVVGNESELRKLDFCRYLRKGKVLGMPLRMTLDEGVLG